MADRDASDALFRKLSPSQIRELTTTEIDAVFGGDGYGSESGPPIVVVGPGGGGTGPGGTPSDPGTGSPGGVGGGGGSGTEYAQWQQWAGQAAMAFITGYLANKASTASERETKIADSFDPAQITANMQGMDANGDIDHGYRMRDGSAFFDTDHNGIVDTHMWTDPVGNVWSDEGAGKTLVRGAG